MAANIIRCGFNMASSLFDNQMTFVVRVWHGTKSRDYEVDADSAEQAKKQFQDRFPEAKVEIVK